MAKKTLKVRIVNPAKKKKKAAPRKRAKAKTSRKSAKKGTRTVAKKKRRRRKPSTTTRRRSRRRNPTKRRASPRRKRNPSVSSVGRGLMGAFFTKDMMQQIGWGVAGKWALAFVVRRYGTQWGTGIFGGQPTPSPFAGKAWTGTNYGVGFLTAWVGGHLASRVAGKKAGLHFFRGAMEDMLTRLIWTEGFARNAFTQQHFGEIRSPMGPVIDDTDGTRWLVQPDGSMVSMQGYHGMGMGDVIDASPLDGVIDASPLDGALVDVAPGSRAALIAAYNNTGNTDPYAAAYGATY